MAETSRIGLGRVPWRGGQVAIGILLVVLSLVLASAIALPLGFLAGGYRTAVVAWTSSQLLGLAILGIVWYLGPKRYRVPISSLGLTSPGLPWPRVALLVIGVLVASLAATALYGWLVKLLGYEPLKPPDIPPGIAFPGLAAILTFQALALWTPLAEEAFFRGFVLAGLVPRLGMVRAVVASAAIFSIFHISQGSPGVLVPIFVTGLLLAWLYYRTGSLWASVMAHAGQNAVALAVTLYLPGLDK